MRGITLQEALVWAQVGQQLVSIGIATVSTVQAWIQSQHPGITEGDLNAILDVIAMGAAKHKALAQADAAGG